MVIPELQLALLFAILGLTIWESVLLAKLIQSQQTVQPPPSKVAQVQILLDGKKGVSMFPLQDSKSVTATIALEDALGVVVPGAALDASPAPTWSLDDASFGTLTPSADNLTCVFQPNGKQGVVHMLFAGSVGGVGFTGTSDDIQVQPGPVTQIAMSLA